MAGRREAHLERGAAGGSAVMDSSSEAPRPQSVTGPVVGAIFALCAFAVAVVAGMFSGNTATSVVGRALLAMIVCYPVGLVVGYICQRVVHEHLQAHAQANPLPELAEHEEETAGEQDAAPETAVDEQPIEV